MEQIGEGRTAKVYRLGDRAFKVYAHMPLEVVKTEAERQSFARLAGLPVPEVYGVYQTDEGVTLEMEYVNGIDLLSRGMDRAERHQAFEKLVALQLETHRIHAEGMPRLYDRLTHRIEYESGLDQEAIASLLDRLRALDSGKESLCHGDFHPQNIRKDGDVCWIIDWIDASSGDPLADACRTYLLARMYISRYAGVYLRLYCKAAGVSEKDVLAWLPIIAAARLGERVSESERALLLGLIG